MSIQKFHRLALASLLCVLLPSCLYLTPEGRRLRELRVNHDAQTRTYNIKQEQLQEARARKNKLDKEVSSLRSKIRKREAALRARQAKTDSDAELKALKRQLEQKERESASVRASLREAY